MSWRLHNHFIKTLLISSHIQEKLGFISNLTWLLVCCENVKADKIFKSINTMQQDRLNSLATLRIEKDMIPQTLTHVWTEVWTLYQKLDRNELSESFGIKIISHMVSK